MTGFGKCRRSNESRTIEVEIRSVNHRFFKGQMRLSRELQPHESELENRIKAKIKRGSVNLNVRLQENKTEASYTIDQIEARSLYEAAAELAASLGREKPQIDRILSLPGVVVPRDHDDGPSPETIDEVREAVSTAVSELVTMRDREGQLLEKELREIRARIEEQLIVVKGRAPKVVEEYREKLRRRLTQLLADCSDKVAVRDDDVIRETAMFADRADISEEIQRLESHIEQFDSVIEEDEVGRKLDFLLQEMLRESNTIASKASDAEIARNVIEIKTDLERLREQAQNIE